MNKPYKNDIKYVNGIYNMLKYYRNNKPEFKFRIYYDDSVLKKDNKWQDMFNMLLQQNDIDLIKYEFKQFKESPVFHDNVFGMMVRFIPLFNFDKTNEIIVVSDIDFGSGDDVIKNISSSINDNALINKLNKDNTVMFVLYGYDSYISKHRLRIDNLIKNYNLYLRAVSPSCYYVYKYKKEIFLDFLDCVYNNCSTYQEWISTTFKHINCNTTLAPKEISMCKSYITYKKSVFIFGLDEFFLNYYLMGTLARDKIPMYVHTRLPTPTDYNYLIYELYKENKLNENYIRKMKKYILQNEYKNDIKENFNTIDKKIT